MVTVLAKETEVLTFIYNFVMLITRMFYLLAS